MRHLNPVHLALVLVALAGLFSGLYGITGRTSATQDLHAARALAESRKVEIDRLRTKLATMTGVAHELAKGSQACRAAQEGCMEELAGCR